VPYLEEVHLALRRCWSDVLIWVGVTAACGPRVPSPAQELATARAAIAAQIARSVQATRDKDIDALLSVQTPDFTLQNDTTGDEHGELLTRDKLRANLLRDWSVIAENGTIDIQIDSLTLQGDTATVYTRQLYERLMHQREGPLLDTVVTSVKHREVWRRLPQGWRVAHIEELWHGPILVNGQIYTP
jgi:ketosteroid isomerase-like protein